MLYHRPKANLYVFLIILVIAVFLFVRLNQRTNDFIQTYDDSLYPNMHSLIFNITDVDISKYISGLTAEYSNTTDLFARADIKLVLARLLKNSTFYLDACLLYASINDSDYEQTAIKYESLASLNCYNAKRRWLQKAAYNWEMLNITWRANILKSIILNENISTKVKFDVQMPIPELNLSNASIIAIGESKLSIKPGMTIVSQEDRVYRDWLSLQLSANPFDSTPLKVFSEKFTYDEEELRSDIGWHEGGELLDIMKKVEVRHKVAVGTLAIQNPSDGKWYAPDAKGIFSFNVLDDKIYYPTTRFLAQGVAMIIDTHGISAIAEQAVRDHADIVIGCCDSIGKVKAALYLSSLNISVICITDRFGYYALGDNSRIIGSARLYSDPNDNKTAVMGGAELKIRRNEKIVVSNTPESKQYPMFYYASPYYYFSQINKTFPIDLIGVELTEYNQTRNVFNIAESQNATIVGFRVYNSNDYTYARKWLNESSKNMIVLFHSMAYPYGKLLVNEYPNQTTFGDLNPRIQN